MTALVNKKVNVRSSSAGLPEQEGHRYRRKEIVNVKVIVNVKQNMKDIAIFGAGGFGREVACLIKRINKAQGEPVWNFIGFFDDNEKGVL